MSEIRSELGPMKMKPEATGVQHEGVIESSYGIDPELLP
jgi:hypothetical protein